VDPSKLHDLEGALSIIVNYGIALCQF